MKIKEIHGFPVVARRHSPEVFELVKASFDAIALLVYLRIISSGILAVGAWGNDGDGAALLDALNERLAVISLVGNHMRWSPPPHQRWGLRDIVRLPAREHKAHWAALGIRRHVDVRRQSAAGTPHSLVLVPPLPVADG